MKTHLLLILWAATICGCSKLVHTEGPADCNRDSRLFPSGVPLIRRTSESPERRTGKNGQRPEPVPVL